MTDDFEGVVIVESYEEEFHGSDPGRNKGCLRVAAFLMAFIIILTAAVPLTFFLTRRSYQLQIERFPDKVCENFSAAGFYDLPCDPSQSLNEFVNRSFPIGTPRSIVDAAMQGFQFREQTGISQPACAKPDLLTYSVAKTFTGWILELELLFCSDALIKRTLLVNGSPISLPTYDL